MIMEKIILVPVGGLANRMRAVASAVTLTYRVRRKLEVLWFRDWGLNAPFFKVFEETGVDEYILFGDILQTFAYV